MVPLAPYGSPQIDSIDKHDNHPELNRQVIAGTTQVGTTREKSPYLKTLDKQNDNQYNINKVMAQSQLASK